MTYHLSNLGLLARHHIKRAIPRQRAVFGISFPDVATTQTLFLELIDQGIYQVRQDRRGRIGRSGVVRIGSHFLTLDYSPFSAFRPSNLWRGGPKIHLPTVLPIWSHDWMTYYHWLIDVAPRLATAKHHFNNAKAEPFFLYPGELSSYQRETVEALGLSLCNVIDLHQTGIVTADIIYAMPLLGFFRVDQPRLQVLRSFLGVVRKPRRRLYVSRQGRRRIKNEADLFELLEKFGFEFVPDVPRTLKDQIELFAEASHIIAPHGAALSNLIWSSPRTRVLELANSHYSPDYFKNLASGCGMSYNRLTFGVGTSNWMATADDIVVDVDATYQFLANGWSL
jgi:capsular polysaccharide biosynthesis protein